MQTRKYGHGLFNGGSFRGFVAESLGAMINQGPGGLTTSGGLIQIQPPVVPPSVINPPAPASQPVATCQLPIGLPGQGPLTMAANGGTCPAGWTLIPAPLPPLPAGLPFQTNWQFTPPPSGPPLPASIVPTPANTLQPGVVVPPPVGNPNIVHPNLNLTSNPSLTQDPLAQPGVNIAQIAAQQPVIPAWAQPLSPVQNMAAPAGFDFVPVVAIGAAAVGVFLLIYLL